MRADTPSRNPDALFEPSKQLGNAIFRERTAGFGKEDMIFSRTSPLGESFFRRPMMIQVVQQVLLAVLTKGNTPLFGTFFANSDNPTLAIKVIESQATEFRDANTCIIKTQRMALFRIAARSAIGPVLLGGAQAQRRLSNSSAVMV